MKTSQHFVRPGFVSAGCFSSFDSRQTADQSAVVKLLNVTNRAATHAQRDANSRKHNMTKETETIAPLTDAVVVLTGTDGNAFSILGRIRRGILRSNHPELVDQFVTEATAGDYDHLLVTCFKYVTVE
jgi:hypothetical protein